MSIVWLNWVPVWEAFAWKWHCKGFCLLTLSNCCTTCAPLGGCLSLKPMDSFPKPSGTASKHLWWKLCKTHFALKNLCKVTLLNTSEHKLWLEINRQFCQSNSFSISWYDSCRLRGGGGGCEIRFFLSFKSKSFIWGMIGSAQFEITR